MLCATSAVAFFRVAPESWRGVVWAEDGAIFLQQAYTTRLDQSLLEPYAGYSHLWCRLVAEAVASLVPVSWQGLALNIAAAVAIGWLATLSAQVVRAHTGSRWAPWAMAAAVAAVPVGPEVFDNIANTQWFLLPVAFIALFWTAPTGAWRVAVAATLFIATASSPFGMLVTLVACLSWLLLRDRARLLVAVSALAGTVLQTVVMLGAPARAEAGPPAPWQAVPAGALRRVLGDGVLGYARHDPSLPSFSLTAGLVVALVVAALLATAVATGGGSTVTLTVVVAGCALGVYLVPLTVSRADTVSSWVTGRYYVPAVLLMWFALVVLAHHALRAASSGPRSPVRWAGAAVAGALLVAAGYGMVDSALAPTPVGRVDGPSWEASVDDARSVCSASGRAQAEIAIAPPGWEVLVPCADVR